MSRPEHARKLTLSSWTHSDTGRMGRRNLSETELLVLGFNEGLGGALAVGVLVQSAKAANSKVEGRFSRSCRAYSTS